MSTFGYQGGIECHLFILNAHWDPERIECQLSDIKAESSVIFYFKGECVHSDPESLVIGVAKVIGRHNMLHN